MAGDSIFYIIQARDKFSATLNKFDRQLSKIQKQAAKSGKTIKKFSTESFLATVNWKIFFGAAALAVGAFSIKAVEGYKAMELQIKNTTGSAKIAASVMAQLSKMSGVIPLPLKDIAKAEQMLLAHNLTQKKSLKITKELSAVAAGFGANLGTLATQYDLINAKGAASLRTLRPFMRAGVPIIKVMEKIAIQLGKTHAQFQEAFNKGRLNALLFDKALEQLTEKGGAAYNALKDAGDTFRGSLVLLNNVLMRYANALFKAIFGSATLGKEIHKIQIALNNALPRFQNLIKVHPMLFKLAGFFLSMSAAVITLAGAVKILAIAFGALNALLTPELGIIVALTAAIYGAYKLIQLIKKSQVGAGKKGAYFGGVMPSPPEMKPIKAVAHGYYAGEKKHRIDIHLHDPAKNVASVTTTSGDKYTTFNVGRNMAGALGVL